MEFCTTFAMYYSLGAMITGAILLAFCIDQLWERPFQVLMVILGVSAVWFYPMYKVCHFVYTDIRDTRAARRKP